jgi:hypothetical protein
VADIQSLSKLSLETALKLFDMKIVPILTYGLEILWEHLGGNSLKTLECMKAIYLKKALRVSRCTLSWLVYILARESLPIEDLQYKLLLPSINAANRLIIQRRKKKRKIWFEFCSKAVINREWTKPNYDPRHLVTHGRAWLPSQDLPNEGLPLPKRKLLVQAM